MKKLSFLFLLSVLIIKSSFCQIGDTVIVQTFTFGSPQEAWFQFPSDTVRFEKILMLYTLKCNPAQNPACGEWDYLTYTYLYNHTGLTDSALVHQPTFKVNDNVKDTFNYVNYPTYSYETGWQYNIFHDDTVSLNTFNSGSGTTSSAIPFGSSSKSSRTQYLWKAADLSAIGMSNGNITGIRFDVSSTGSILNNLVIRMKHSTLDSLHTTTFSASGFTEVYRQNTLFASAGWNHLQFITPFYWDGTSNIIMEVCFDKLQQLPTTPSILLLHLMPRAYTTASTTVT